MYSGGCEAGLQFMEKTTGTKCPKFSNPPDYFLNLINSDFEGKNKRRKITTRNEVPWVIIDYHGFSWSISI